MKTAEDQLKYLWHCWCLTYVQHLQEAPANGLRVDLGSAERGTDCLEQGICAASGDSAYGLKLKKLIEEKGRRKRRRGVTLNKYPCCMVI